MMAMNMMNGAWRGTNIACGVWYIEDTRSQQERRECVH